MSKIFKAIEDTVNGIIQGTFTLIGIHEQEHKITAKIHEYEAEAQKRKKPTRRDRELQVPLLEAGPYKRWN
jgi:hypothetical protein